MADSCSTGRSCRELISVIVVNHDRAEMLRSCIQSLLDQSYRKLEVVVVDNASVDASESVVRGFDDPRVRWVALKENRGFAGGCNAGLLRCRGRLVALLNNDAVAQPDWLEELVKGLEADPSVGMCASKILFFDSNIIDKAGHLMYWDGQNRGRGTGRPDGGEFGQAEEALFPDGCAALYRREVMDEVGGFDEDFFAYGDDSDLGLRARLRGWKCWYVPDAVVHHHHSSTLGPYSPQKIYWVERNRIWLACKSFPWFLLLIAPLFTLYRSLWNLFAYWTGRGAAGNLARQASFTVSVRILARACRDALSGLGRIWPKRREVRRNAVLSDTALIRLLWRFRISARELATQDRTAFHDTSMNERPGPVRK